MAGDIQMQARDIAWWRMWPFASAVVYRFGFLIT
jgi:hypothetical protein